MTMLRDLGTLDRFPHLRRLGLDPEDVGRLDVAGGAADHAGYFVEATSGEARLLQAGDPVPDGVWVAQRDLDGLRPGPGTREEPHGFGEGWGKQGEQLGGDRSYPEEDAGGTRRVPHGDLEGSGAEPNDNA
jgi:hypothetical protein